MHTGRFSFHTGASKQLDMTLVEKLKAMVSTTIAHSFIRFLGCCFFFEHFCGVVGGSYHLKTEGENSRAHTDGHTDISRHKQMRTQIAAKHDTPRLNGALGFTMETSSINDNTSGVFHAATY